MITMEYIKSDFDNRYPILNVELLGKPIHIIKDELANILSNSLLGLTDQIQKWVKTHELTMSVTSIDFQSPKQGQHAAFTVAHNDGGMMNFRCSAPLLIVLADRFYHSSVNRLNSAKSQTITTSDLRLQERIGRLFSAQIAPENMWQACDNSLSDDIGLVIQLSVTCEETIGDIIICIDSALIQTLTSVIGLQPTSELNALFSQQLESTKVKLNTVLCERQMPLDQVLQLKPGDIFDIDLLQSSPISIGQEHLFNGHVAEQNGQLVLIINTSKDT